MQFAPRVGSFPNVAALMGGAPSNGNDGATVVLLHMDGADASTDFTDSNVGGAGKVWTARGNAQVDTADKKFGTGSLLLDGTGDYLDTPDHDDFNFGSGDFTIDCWFKRSALNGSSNTLFGISSSGFSNTLYLDVNNSNHLQLVVNGGTINIETTTNMNSTAVWYHAAVTRSGNTWRVFLNGTQEATTTNSLTVTDEATKPTIGRLGEANFAYFNGWIDEFRVSKGVARWTSNFTPPTEAYS